ncbi:hypothetical protein K466DRAFT_658692 [Polyporus arcularius HHB13444]|uniref:Uncharacterized protein n=1 Tax=Polyporus arcularius HHB13444 TaxID=1314778 RepID=A0A5C3PUN7_9APHY|nr:hypothetical protein K466DRAFT_658692 [Polyporus arcularius HHB13444]
MSAWTGPHAGDKPCPRNNNTDLIAGDVYSIQESIYAAIFDILHNSNIADRHLYARCKEAARRLQLREKATKKIRPCVVMRNQAPTVHRAKDCDRICLTTSWEKTALTDLPELFQFFSFAIFRDRCDDSEHCHSLPAWDIDNAFVFAWVFRSERPLINQWPERQRGDPPENPCVFGQNALEEIQNVCDAKKAEWDAKCKEDPEYAARNARACLKHMKAREKELAKAEMAATGASLHSAGTGLTGKTAFSRNTHASVLSAQSYQSFHSNGTYRSGRGADCKNWRDFGSLTDAAGAFKDPEGFIFAGSSKLKLWKPTWRDADEPLVISVANNKYAILRRGSRDH